MSEDVHVFVKPTGVARGKEPFDVGQGLFRPTMESISNVIHDWLSLRSSDAQATLCAALGASDKARVNILGGLFVAGLIQEGFKHDGVLCRVFVDQSDQAFLTTLYPDLAKDLERGPAAGKILNNLGEFSVHRFRSDCGSGRKRIQKLKESFRKTVGFHVEIASPVAWKDHIVHVPGSESEDQEHVSAALKLTWG